MKKHIFLLFAILLILLTSCFNIENEMINAEEHGVSAKNTGEENSKALQALIDRYENSGKTIYIPAGEYEFAENGKQTIGSHCIKMRSGVSILGDGEKTVLKPVGRSRYGLDMFYFNDYIDKEEAVYLENCRFEGFTIDALGTSCEIYTSAGKGFMFNLFRNCHFKDVTVRNTDATGFGVDCPIDSTISGCTAVGCGKAATDESNGASGFGIGFGYSEDESIVISDCTASKNKKFGFFLEHQGRFNIEKYNAMPKKSFTVKNCFAKENLFGFGGINAFSTLYEDCSAESSRRFGFFFENSFASAVKNCSSDGEKEACFAVFQNIDENEIPADIGELSFLNCEGRNTPCGFLLPKDTFGLPEPDEDGCVFAGVQSEYSVWES